MKKATYILVASGEQVTAWGKQIQGEELKKWLAKIYASDYKWPRALASASTRSTSRCRSESFFATQVSHDFPVAVSSPVKAIVATSEYGIVMVPLLVAGKSSIVGWSPVAVRLNK